MPLNRLRHVAIICSDYPRSKKFYVFATIAELKHHGLECERVRIDALTNLRQRFAVLKAFSQNMQR